MTHSAPTQEDQGGGASINRPDFRSRAWALILLDAAGQAGLTPISKRRFHRLAYLANALSRVYHLRAADEHIVKYRRGPFYPNLQWHIDRLAGEGFVEITNVVHEADEFGPWMEADYALERCAIQPLTALGQIEWGDYHHRFLLEVATAFARQADQLLDALSEEDLTYADARHGLGAVINFSRYKDNLSARAAQAFKGFAAEPIAISLSDQIHLYLDYIQEKLERAAG